MKFLQAHISQKQIDALTQYAEMAVKSLQQQLGDAPGDEKKNLAMAILKGLLEQNKYKFDSTTLHNAIEAAVLQMKQEAPVKLEAAVLSAPGEIHEESGAVLTSVKVTPVTESAPTT